MGEVAMLVLILTTALVLLDKTSSQMLPRPQPRESARPLCISQLALANQACASIPFRTVTRTHTHSVVSEGDELADAPSPAPGPRPAMDQLYHSRHHHRHHKREDKDHDSSSHDHDHESSSHRHRSKRRNEGKHNHHNHHGHHHKRKEGHHHGTEECCRWLKAMDDRCVCTLLLRLPAFLSGPAHGYTVSVDDDCEVEFECPGRFMQTT